MEMEQHHGVRGMKWGAGRIFTPPKVKERGPRKTGGGGGVWIELEKPKPPRVEDHYEYWGEAPPERSQRCEYWVRQIERGWRPNRLIPDCYCCGSEWHGVYIWEYLHVIRPLLAEMRVRDQAETATDGNGQK